MLRIILPSCSSFGEITFLPSLFIKKGLLTVSMILSERTGTSVCSPSLNLSPSAIIRQPITPSFTSGTWNDQLTVVISPAASSNTFCDFVRQTTGSPFSGLNNSRRARPFASSPLWFIICDEIYTMSPTRKNLGSEGWTISGLDVTISFWI